MALFLVPFPTGKGLKFFSNIISCVFAKYRDMQREEIVHILKCSMLGKVYFVKVIQRKYLMSHYPLPHEQIK